MALSKTVTFRTLLVSDAYHRVVGLHASRDRGDCAIHVRSFKDADSAAQGDQGFDQQTFLAPYDPDMTVAEAYAFLKTQPEFDGAVDA